MMSMNNILPLIVIVLIAFSVLRALVPRQIQLRQDPTGFRLQRPLGVRLLDTVRSVAASLVMIALFVASYGTDFEIGLIVSAVALVMLSWGVVNRLWRSAVLISRLQNRVLYGPRLVGRTSDVRAVELRLDRRAPLSLMFRDPNGPDWRWVIPGADARSARLVGEQIAGYLGVPLEQSW
jgi:hypothetical protein